MRVTTVEDGDDSDTDEDGNADEDSGADADSGADEDGRANAVDFTGVVVGATDML
jgi:hypothetical protein